MNDSLPKRGGMRWLVLIPVLIIVGAWGYAELALHWSYSAGERVGTLQKLSSKGWVCKTNEGEIAMYIVSGVSPQLWDFTVRDDAVAAQLNQYLGQRVRLHYEEHRGLPSCFGDTQYFVDAVSLAPQ